MSGNKLWGCLKGLVLPPRVPVRFGDLIKAPGRSDYERKIVSFVVDAVDRISGGDSKTLLQYIHKKKGGDFSLPAASGDANGASLTSSLVEIQTSFMDFLSMEAKQNLAQRKKNIQKSQSEQKSNANDGKSEEKDVSVIEIQPARKSKNVYQRAKQSLRLLNSVFVNAGISFTECKNMGSGMKRSTFFALKKELEKKNVASFATPFDWPFAVF